nr:E3 ubiquitin-protein ligase TRIM39-like isoform X2 [Chelonoidis abingdonii]
MSCSHKSHAAPSHGNTMPSLSEAPAAVHPMSQPVPPLSLPTIGPHQGREAASGVYLPASVLAAAGKGAPPAEGAGQRGPGCEAAAAGEHQPPPPEGNTAAWTGSRARGEVPAPSCCAPEGRRKHLEQVGASFVPSGIGEGAGGRGLPIPAAEYSCFCISRVAYKLHLLLACAPTYRRYKKMKLPELASAPTAELEESIRHHSRKRRALQDEMWESREILTLDAASAHPGLVVSPDRHSVWHGNSGGCPPSDHRRFFPASCILGSEGFSSGRHRWEVEVGDKDGWAVGVARESVRRRDPMELQPQHGVWAVELGWYQLLPLSPWPPAAAPSQRPHRIQVCLDYEGGRVSFYDAENLTPLFTFTASFTETLFPFFWLWAPSARITLCP